MIVTRYSDAGELRYMLIYAIHNLREAKGRSEERQ